jgi:hypothetical protein
MDPGLRRDDSVNMSPAYRGLPRIRLQPGGFDTGDRGVEKIGLALAAELNGYPGPSHVLELAAEAAERYNADTAQPMHPTKPQHKGGAAHKTP